MATRSLTHRYESFRGSAHRSRTPKSESFSSGHQGLLSDSGLSDVALSPSLPPEWVDIVDIIKKDMGKVKDNRNNSDNNTSTTHAEFVFFVYVLVRSLSVLHGKRLQVSFDDAIQEQERDIEILTQEITRLLRKSESNVKRIASAGASGSGPLSDSDRVSRLNVMRGIAQDLQEQSRKFRQLQKTFLHNLRAQETSGDNFGFRDTESEKTALSIEEGLDRGLSADQLDQMQSLSEKSDQRYQDIVKIAQSINELASLFRELNVLVIEQGSLLDRIDYNLEQTSIHVTKGNVELKAADEYSKRAYTMKCILILIIIVIILLAILIAKKAK